MLELLLVVLGIMIFEDGLYSLWAYTRKDRVHNQNRGDHALRLWRMVMGLAVAGIGFWLVLES